MSDLPEPTTPVQPTEPPEKGTSVGSALAAISVTAWVVAAVVAFIQWSNFKTSSDSFGISAPQISQLADQALISVLPWLVVAFASTGIMIAMDVARRSSVINAG